MPFKLNPITGKLDYYPKLDDCAAPDDNTDLDASTSKHGLLLKLGGGTSNFLRADGSWNAPPVLAHTHDTDTLQLDGINSDGGAFAFTTSGAVTFSQSIIVDGGDIGITGDTDILQISAGLLKVNGNLQVISSTYVASITPGNNCILNGGSAAGSFEFKVGNRTTLYQVGTAETRFYYNAVEQMRTENGSIKLTGNLKVDGGDIGITADTDLIQLANAAVTINGTLGLLSGTTINEFSVDGTLGGNSDDAVPTEKAVKTYADAIGTLLLTHASRHQNTGSDEINVGGLSGELADNQPPKTHAASHTDTSDDIQNATDAQKGLATAAQITKLDGIENAATADQNKTDIDGLGLSHDSLSDVSVDDHHAQAHTHNTDTLQLDGINSNGGAFAFTTSGAITFNQDLIVDGGNIGITADPDLISMATNALTVNGTVTAAAGSTFGDTYITNQQIQINVNGSGNRYAYLEFHGDDTYTDFALRIIRWNDGVNAASDLTHRGTGDLKIATQDAADLKFDTTNTTRMTIAATGEITVAGNLRVDGGDIGITADTNLMQLAADALTVNGTLTTTGIAGIANTDIRSDSIKINTDGSGNRYAIIDLVGDDTYTDYGFRFIRLNTGANAISQLVHRGTGDFEIKTLEVSDLAFKTSNITRMTIAAGGDITMTGDLLMGNASPLIAPATSDGSDNSYLGLAGGGDVSATRGGVLKVYGNEFNAGGYKGRVEIAAGNVYASGYDGGIVFRTGNNVVRMVIQTGGAITVDSGATLGFAAGTTINEFSTDDTLGGNSDNAVPTEQAVKAYVDGVAGGAKIKTGTYTGDGSTGQAITGVGFQPKWVIIYTHVNSEFAVNGAWGVAHWKIDQSWGDYDLQEAGNEVYSRDSRLNSLDADGFTVDDDGDDRDPNKNNQVYDYLALG